MIEKQIEEQYSQRWEIYRIATHEKGGLDIAADMSCKYSTRQLYQMLETLDVYDTLKKLAHDKAEAESKKNK